MVIKLASGKELTLEECMEVVEKFDLIFGRKKTESVPYPVYPAYPWYHDPNYIYPKVTSKETTSEV